MATRRTLPQATLQQTLTYLFDDSPHALAEPVSTWMTTSKAFAAFALTYQQKIRKKVRMSQDAEQMQSLYCELRTAYLLLQEPKLAVAYEPYTIQQGRSPDFGVTYRTRTAFHVEVTRLRLSRQEQLAGSERDEGGAGDAQRYVAGRLADVICAKLGQLAPDTPNALFVWVQSPTVQAMDLDAWIPALKRRAEQRDETLLARNGFRDPADFIRHYQRLSLVLVRSLHEQGAEQAPLLWHNNDARHPFPARLRELLTSLVIADTSPLPSAGPSAGYGAAGQSL